MFTGRNMDMDNMLGMLIGAAIDREDGDSGLKGAIIGSVAESAIKIAVPLALTFAIGWGVQFLARRAVAAVTGPDAIAKAR